MAIQEAKRCKFKEGILQFSLLHSDAKFSDKPYLFNGELKSFN